MKGGDSVKKEYLEYKTDGRTKFPKSSKKGEFENFYKKRGGWQNGGSRKKGCYLIFLNG